MLWNVTRVHLSVLLGLLVHLSFHVKVDAHSAPSGWYYPYQCCSDRDCQPVHDTAVVEGPEGYIVEETGEIIGYQDPRVKPSPDGEFHLCLGTGNFLTRCLFVPPRAVMGMAPSLNRNDG
ncbi:hypothetical protein J2Z31_005355 [Sinorhizobium kostiense]|uniref:Secreted protein n=1 Tax=Sinorhizobium kostiense TaxID=76747 RepID=A0ABS4R923_9HYPH|nr:hypothetical protein [Sinorhizobium kostiense]